MLDDSELTDLVVDFLDAVMAGLAAEARGEVGSPAFVESGWRAEELLRRLDGAELKQVIARMAIIYLGAVAESEGAVDMNELEKIYSENP